MKLSRTLVIKSVDTSTLQAKTAVIFTAISLVLPVFFHLLPNSLGASGPQLLPLFYAPFIAVLFFRLPIALILGILAPFANWLFFGKPSIEWVIQLASELSVFVLTVYLLKDLKGIRWLNAPFSFIVAKLSIWLGMLGLVWMGSEGVTPILFTKAVEFAAPGIFILLGLNILMLSFKNREGDGQQA